MIGHMAHTDAANVLAILGGRKALGSTPRTSGDFIALVRSGLPYSSLRSATKALAFSLQDLEGSLHLSSRSLHRRRGARLTPVESERVMRLVRVAARAGRVLGDMPAALDWLVSPNRALGGQPPIELLDTDLGTEEVLQVLGRIEFGIYT
jgi:putative toxin-antitoxin system antitoxin component (TIGR02293 family)